MYEKALDFQRRGVSIIPIEKGGKKPLIKWLEYAEKPATKEKVEEWFKDKDINIAMVCGKVSSYTVIDLDKKDDRDLLAYAKELGFPETITVKTPGGGYHLYYQYNPYWKTGVRVFDLVDVRNDSSYVLLPPSENEKGVKYELIKQCSPAKLPDNLDQKRWYEKDENKWDEVIKGVGQGSRNETAAKMAGLYLRVLTVEEAWQALSVWNGQNDPPLPEWELKNTFNSINKREQAQKKERGGEVNVEELESKYKLVTFTELLERSSRELDQTKAEECVSFGYDWLDHKITGLFPGELMVIGGETGTGKTTFATKIIYKAAINQGVKCCVMALEDRLNDYGIKAIYFEIGRLRKRDGLNQYPWNAYRKNDIDDSNYQAYKAEAIKNIGTDKIHFVEVQEMMSIELLKVIMDTLTAQGFELFLIDHLHYFDLLKGDSNKADYVERVMVEMKQNMNRNGARVILISHYRKLNGAKPSDGAFKDSMAIAQNANYTMHLWRDKQEPDGTTEIFISKSRNPNGEAHITVNYDAETNEYSLGGVDAFDEAWEDGTGDGEVKQTKLINELPK